MPDIRFTKVSAGYTTVNVVGELVYEHIGEGEICFMDERLEFCKLIFPYREIEAPKLLIDRLFFKNNIRIDGIVGEKQYSFCFRANQDKLEKVPINWEVSVNRRRWANFAYLYMIICILVGGSLSVFQLLIK